MLTDAELCDMRDTVETVMVDTCVIARDGTATLDPGTGLVSSTPTTIYSGVCQLQQAGVEANATIFGGAAVTRQRFVLAVPHDATGIGIEDRVTVTSSWDSSAVGRALRVTAVPSRSFNLYRAVGCEVVE